MRVHYGVVVGVGFLIAEDVAAWPVFMIEVGDIVGVGIFISIFGMLTGYVFSNPFKFNYIPLFKPLKYLKSSWMTSSN